MRIHLTTFEQSRVQSVLVIGRKNHDPLFATAGPKLVCKIKQTRQSDGRETPFSVTGLVLARLKGPLVHYLGGQIASAVDVLDDDTRFAWGSEQELTESGIVWHIGELQIINIVVHVIGNGGDEARLAHTRRVVQKITPLPCSARPTVELSALQKTIGGLLNLVFDWGLEGKGFKGGVPECHWGPSSSIVVVEELPNLTAPLQVVCDLEMQSM